MSAILGVEGMALNAGLVLVVVVCCSKLAGRSVSEGASLLNGEADDDERWSGLYSLS